MITNFKMYENIQPQQNNSIVDFTFLKVHSNIDEIKKICDDAIKNNVYGVVLSSDNIGTASAFLEDTDIKIIAVIDFPKGKSKSNFRSNMVLDTITDGVDEVEVVFNYTKLKELSILKDEEYNDVYNELVDDIQNMSRISHKNGIIIKIIIEIEELNYEEIKLVCEICESASVDFIQTSTGYSKKKPNWGEKIEKIKFIRRILPQYINIKVSGGIRNSSQIDELINLGVDRIGTSILIK